jgi:ComF family protein
MQKSKLNSIIFSLKEFILNLAFPRKCVGCGQEGAWICEKCEKKIVTVKSPTCPICNKLTKNGHFCSRHRKDKALTGIIVAAYYREGPLKEAIHFFKYRYIREIADLLADLVIERLKLGFPYGDLVIIAAPLHRSREAMRGYNQAELLAKRVSKDYDIELVSDAVRRVMNNRPQVEMTGEERRKNIKGVFAMGLGIERVKNKTVLIVDDITTTGATLNEIALVLKKAGAKHVWGLVVAKG